MEREHLFISDVHLGAFGTEKNESIESDLIRLIEYASLKKAKLYVLGDLFDYWMEFSNSDFVPEIGEKALNAFEQYNAEVEPALFITGNHDNWTLGYFSSLGFDVEPDYRVVNINGKKLFLMHGDGFLNLSGKLERPLLHRILRNKLFLKIYRGLLPKKLVISLMRSFSDSTRKLDHRDAEPLNNHAKSLLSQNIADIVLAGHDHIPRMETFNSGLYINLGTFFHHRTLVRGLNGEFSLVQWDAHNQQFKSYG